MNKKIITRLACAYLCAFSPAAFAAAPAKPAIVIDAHNDTAQRILFERVDVGVGQDGGSIDLPRLVKGGVNAPFFALYVPDFYKGAEAVRRTLDYYDAVKSMVDRHADRFEIATSASDIERVAGKGKIAIVLTIEGGHQIASDLAVLRTYRRLGVLSLTLSHFRANEWADSSTSPAVHNGLTAFGKDVVREMNRIGMVVDVSHVSDKAFFDTLAVTSRPVIASHSSCRAIVDHPRNMSDEMLLALKKNGGVVGVNFYSAFLNAKDAAEATQHISQANQLAPTGTGADLDHYAEQHYLESGWGQPKTGNASVDDAVACIDHVAKLIGVDHVGIGADFDGVPSVPKGLEDISRFPEIRAALAHRGYSETDVAKIMGGNFMRVLRDVEIKNSSMTQ